MRTVSLEMAEKLKAAGLKWEPSEGDIVLADNSAGAKYVCVNVDNYHFWLEKLGYDAENIIEDLEEADCYLWLPTLSGLMHWLDERGWYPNVGRIPRKDYYCDLYGEDEWGYMFEERYFSNTVSHEDAVAQAVLWILEKEVSEDEES